MYILGVSCFFHDGAAALLKDGVLVAAAEEERFTRKKHDHDFPSHAIRFCLEHERIVTQDLDYVVFYEKPFVKFERLLRSLLDAYPRSWRVFPDAMRSWLTQKLWMRNLIMETLDIRPERILFSEHHLSHAASAFFCSPFEESAVLTLDAVGEWTTSSAGRGRATWDHNGTNALTLFSEIRFPHSLGLLYSTFTAFLGFEVNEGEYKVMGMAPYGEPKYVDKILKLIDQQADGGFRLDMSYLCYHYHHAKMFNHRFETLFGPPRSASKRFVTPRTSLYDDPILPTHDEMVNNQYYADIAASIQRVTEEVILRMAHHLHQRTGLKKLCIAGGVGYNSVANHRILKETPFEDLYVHPAAGDSGGAVGAALYAYHVVLGKPRTFVMEHVYWGPEHGEDAVRAALADVGMTGSVMDDQDKLLECAVDGLQAGKVIGWYQGRSEWGPRALGNRSILADPRQPQMKDIVNIKIKFREPFRPFAPSVLVERTEEFFDLPDASRHYPARFMLYVVPVKDEKQDMIPAVTHVDGTARIQTVRREDNPLYYRLIETFGLATGVPVLLNTSFNLKGEPIVATPRDALQTFMASGMDLLIMGRHVLDKQ